MDISKIVPYYQDYTVRQNINKILHRKMLASVLIGQFVGGATASYLVGIFGVYIGNTIGAILSVLLFIYWSKIGEKVDKEVKDKITKQYTLSEFEE